MYFFFFRGKCRTENINYIALELLFVSMWLSTTMETSKPDGKVIIGMDKGPRHPHTSISARYDNRRFKNHRQSIHQGQQVQEPGLAAYSGCSVAWPHHHD